MLCTSEAQLNQQLSSGKIAAVYLLYGNEPMLMRSCLQKILTLPEENGGQVDYMDGKSLDLPAFYDAAQLMPMFGGRRFIVISDFEAEELNDADCKEFCGFLADISEDCIVIITAAQEHFDTKKGKCAKRILAAVDKCGVAAQLNHPSSADLQGFAQARCRTQGKTLPPKAAAFLIEHCGEDMYTLANECDKLCAYAKEDEIDIDMIRRICPGTLTADPFALARLILRGDLKTVMSQLDTLMRLRQPAILILANISSVFCDLARACAARSGGHSASALTTDFSYRYAWRAQNAYRDCAGLDAEKVYAVCEILCQADAALKSSPVDERILLETAIIRTVQTLKGSVSAC